MVENIWNGHIIPNLEVLRTVIYEKNYWIRS